MKLDLVQLGNKQVPISKNMGYENTSEPEQKIFVIRRQILSLKNKIKSIKIKIIKLKNIMKQSKKT